MTCFSRSNTGKTLWNHQQQKFIFDYYFVASSLAFRIPEFFEALTILMINNILHQAASNFPKDQLT